jgi:proteic killer suppression protein
MIASFRHKGLRTFFESGSTRGIRPEHAKRLRLILGRLHASRSPEDMKLPGLRMHGLKGKLKGQFAVSISGNWRLTFRFEGPDAMDVDYLDYH